MSQSEPGGYNNGGSNPGFPGRFETAAHGHEPHQNTQALGTHPAETLEGYTRNGTFTLQPKHATVDEILYASYSISGEHVIDLEGMR